VLRERLVASDGFGPSLLGTRPRVRSRVSRTPSCPPEPGDWRQLCIQAARLHARPST
jgi:hypothetical protein